MLRVIARNGYARSSMPAYAGELSCSINSWMDCRPCGERCAPSYWPRAGNTKPRSCCVKFRQIPCIGPIGAARLLALMQTPHRFRSKRQLWTYRGLGIEARDSAQYRFVRGQLQRAKKPQQIRGLNRNHNHEMKEIFKGAATRASCGVSRLRDFYVALLDKGMQAEMARLTLARKIAAIALTLWKKEERFDAEQLKLQAALAWHRTQGGLPGFTPRW